MRRHVLLLGGLDRAESGAVAERVEDVRPLRDLREPRLLALQRVLEVADPGDQDLGVGVDHLGAGLEGLDALDDLVEVDAADHADRAGLGLARGRHPGEVVHPGRVVHVVGDVGPGLVGAERLQEADLGVLGGDLLGRLVERRGVKDHELRAALLDHLAHGPRAVGGGHRLELADHLEVERILNPLDRVGHAGVPGQVVGLPEQQHRRLDGLAARRGAGSGGGRGIGRAAVVVVTTGDEPHAEHQREEQRSPQPFPETSWHALSFTLPLPGAVAVGGRRRAVGACK